MASYRFKADSTGLLDLCSKLNVYGNTPFAELSGVLPAVDSSAVLEQRRHNFTFRDDSVVKVCTVLLSEGNEALNFRLQTPGNAWLFRRDVIRGLRGANDDAERSVMYTGAPPVVRYC